MTSEKLDDYLDGRLPPDAQRAFEKQLQTNHELRESLQLHEQIRRALEAEGRADLFDSLDALDEAEQEVALPAPTSTLSISHFPRLLVAAAAAVLLLVGLWWTFSTPSPESLYANYYEAYPNYQSSQSRGEEQTLRFQAAIQAYESGNYSKALYSFEQLPSNWQEQPEVQFYLGICHLEQQNWKKATAALRYVYQSDKMKEQATWYLALAQLRQENQAAAKELLHEIVQQPDHPYHTKAKQLLDQLS